MARTNHIRFSTLDLHQHSGGSMRSLQTTIALLVALLLLLASQAISLAGQTAEGFIVGPDKQMKIAAIPPTPMLKLQNGNSLQFLEMRGEHERVEGVAMLEIAARGQRGVASVEGLRGANPLEVFNALSREGTAMPSILTDLYGEPQLSPQGWGAPEPDVHETIPTPSNDVSYKIPETGKSYLRHSGCGVRRGSYPQQWHSALEYGLNTYPDFYISPLDGPVTMPQHWHIGPDQPNVGSGG